MVVEYKWHCCSNQTLPALTLFANVMARSMFLVKTDAARPYVVAFAFSIASSIVLNLKID